MLNALQQSTAATLYVGPVLDPSGSPYAAATISDFQLVKNAARSSFNASATATYDAAGYYAIAAQAGWR